ncbi:MAG TPA: hypothetical protein VG204_14850 [Terriglobia bacterium]|nr:hypothetical protein [Terriglobia bacterium]
MIILLRNWKSVVSFVVAFAFFAYLTIRNDPHLDARVEYYRHTVGGVVVGILALLFLWNVWRK